MKTLKEAKIGQTVKVVKLHGEGPIKRRIILINVCWSLIFTGSDLSSSLQAYWS